jgi:hypothetical protein
MTGEAIGGYFGLELPGAVGEYHADAHRLNSGRNSLRLLLESASFSAIFLPRFTCGVVLDTVQDTGVPIQLYDIDERLEIVEEAIRPGPAEAILYTNYFGIKDHYVQRLANRYENLIIDNCQAFFSPPEPSVHTFYSPRKFFGVPDGGYLYTPDTIPIHERVETRDVSWDRCTHLLKRPDIGPEQGYEDFQINDRHFETRVVRAMSNLTSRILASVDYESVRRRRNENFRFLHEALAKTNLLDFDCDADVAPLSYPYLCEGGERIRAGLVGLRVYCAAYWPDVLHRCRPESTESFLCRSVVHLPLDQRYSTADMASIVEKMGVI